MNIITENRFVAISELFSSIFNLSISLHNIYDNGRKQLLQYQNYLAAILQNIITFPIFYRSDTRNSKTIEFSDI